MLRLIQIRAARLRNSAFVCVGVFVLLSALVLAQDEVDAAGEHQLLLLVNQERAQQGLASLTLDARLTQAARKHTQRMIDADSLVHQVPGEAPLLLRLADENIRTDHDAENIVLNSTVALAHEAVMHSPLHRANVLNAAFNAVGVAVIREDELVYVTEDFAHVLPDYTESEADAAAQQAITDFVRSRNLPIPQRRTRAQLTHLACDMAASDKIDAGKARDIPGVTAAIAWTTADLQLLPAGLREVLSQPINSGYSLGVCFAPSKSNPAGIYWLVFVTY